MAKGVPLMGRDPDGKAKIINVDENGNVKVQLSGNIGAEITKPIPFIRRPESRLFFERNSSRATAFRHLESYYVGRDYGIDHGWFSYTTDDWESKTNGVSINSLPFSNIIRGVVWDDGTITVVANDGGVYTMTGIDDAEPVLTLEGTSFANFSVDFYSDGVNRIVLAGEYTQGVTPGNLYLSIDGGETFEVIKVNDTVGSGNNHWHAVKYDPYSGAIWACQGDGENAKIYFSYDLGSTWHEVDGQGKAHQPTLVIPFPDRVIFGEDSSLLTPGLFEYVRTGENDTQITLTRTLEFRTDRRANQYYPEAKTTRLINATTAYVTFAPQGISDLTYIYATGDGGASWHIVHINNKGLLQMGNTSNRLIITIPSTGWFKSEFIKWN
jgi:hypothetical protein